MSEMILVVPLKISYRSKQLFLTFFLLPFVPTWQCKVLFCFFDTTFIPILLDKNFFVEPCQKIDLRWICFTAYLPNARANWLQWTSLEKWFPPNTRQALQRFFFLGNMFKPQTQKKRIKKTLCFKWFYSFHPPPIWVKQIGTKTTEFWVDRKWRHFATWSLYHHQRWRRKENNCANCALVVWWIDSLVANLHPTQQVAIHS